jgi:GDPmannose 4,6-dehydratase
MKRKALILGCAGQDGSYLSEFLLTKDYDVFGTIRRNSTPENQENRISHLSDTITTFYSDLNDIGSLYKLLAEVKPDEVYNLAAQSHVRISFENPQLTVNSNAIGVLNLLEAFRHVCPKAKLYQASSSECFGSSVDDDGYQRESTPMFPVSPYGCAKVFGYNIVRNYRKSYNLYAANGLLFNHESPRRGSNFVTNKVVKAAVRIKLGLQDKLELGNLDSFRDWGHSKDYVRAMWLILQQQEPGDYVVATGVTKSVRDMVEYVFSKLGLDWKQYVECLDKHKRPNELDYLKGDASRIKALGWKPEFTFETLMDDMLHFWLDHYGGELTDIFNVPISIPPPPKEPADRHSKYY